MVRYSRVATSFVAYCLVLQLLALYYRNWLSRMSNINDITLVSKYANLEGPSLC